MDRGVEGVAIWVFESLNFELDAMDSELSERAVRSLMRSSLKENYHV